MATDDDIPHPTIRDAEDRSWTARLLARLEAADLGDAERADVAMSLERLADPRAEPRLAALLADRARPPATREAAGSILRHVDAVDRPTRRRLLREGDAVERRHAVLAMEPGDADLLVPIAADPAHPQHRDAIEAMEFGFEAPAHQALKIAALGHADPRVRRTAADVLGWDHPVAGEGPLARAARDPDDAVSAAALHTLRHYKSRRCLAEVAALRSRRGEPGDVAADTFEELRAWFAAVLCRADDDGREALTSWMAPVWDLLAFDEDELAPTSHERGASRCPAQDIVSADELLTALSAPDGAWAEKRRLLERTDAGGIPDAMRPRLGAFLRTHPDPMVRERSARLLSAWGAQGDLLALLDDPRFAVVKTAMYELGKLSPTPVVARRARAHLDDPRVRGTHAYETLQTFVAHAAEAASLPLLVQLARDDEREPVRWHAVRALARLDAAAEIESLLPLLSEPPRVGWAVHVALLDACGRTDVAPTGAEALTDVDNLVVQEALARVPR